MSEKKSLMIDISIFPKVFTIILGEPQHTDDESEPNKAFGKPEIVADLPRIANVLYLKHILALPESMECKLLEKYAYGIAFSDDEYEKMLKLIMIPVRRTQMQQTGELSLFGLEIKKDNKGKRKLALRDDAISTIKAETWECIIIDHLKQKAFDIIDCFDFNATFKRKQVNNSNNENLKISLGAWKFSTDISEQNLSNMLRTAFIFTLVNYCFENKKDQYDSFSDFFDAEFYKRVSLIYGTWSNRGNKDTIEYIPLYDSFYNLNGINKGDLIEILRSILDDPHIALGDKEDLKKRLIEGAGNFHRGISKADEALEQSLIKPAINFILLREKAKDTLASAQILFYEEKYSDCANRCYYAMMFSLKSLLENKNLLGEWKENELKESESHKTLERGLSALVSQGVLDSNDYAAFLYVRDQRLKCDYSIYIFEKADAKYCLNKVQAFCSKIDNITS